MRVFLAVSWEQLTELSEHPISVPTGHAVTDEVRTELAGSGEEELEYAALTAAAADAVALVTPQRQLRVVLAVDAEARPTGELSAVELPDALSLAQVAAVHVDGPEAAADVLAAASAADEALLDRALDHDLGWYAVQEIPDLLSA